MVQYTEITVRTESGGGTVVRVDFPTSTEKGAGYTALHKLHSLSHDLSLNRDIPKAIEVTFREEVTELAAKELIMDALK